MAEGKSYSDLPSKLEKVTSEFQQKLRQQEETIKALTTDKSKLADKIDGLKGTVRDLTQQLTSKDEASAKIASLEQQLKVKDTVIQELRANLEKTENEKLEYKEGLEKLKVAIDKMDELLTDDGGTNVEGRVSQIPAAKEDSLLTSDDEVLPVFDSRVDTEEKEVIDLDLDNDDGEDTAYNDYCTPRSPPLKRVKLENPDTDDFIDFEVEKRKVWADKLKAALRKDSSSDSDSSDSF